MSASPFPGLMTSNKLKFACSKSLFRDCFVGYLQDTLIQPVYFMSGFWIAWVVAAAAIGYLWASVNRYKYSWPASKHRNHHFTYSPSLKPETKPINLTH